MNVEVKGDWVEVTLSRRNLRTLLLKLDQPSSQKTLFKLCGDKALMLKAEEDDIHYKDEAPGEMHPREEAQLKKKEVA